MSFYLAYKELWRERGRFLLFSLVIALITILVLFVAALGSGLANANRQFIDKLDADLLVLQENVDLSLTTSRLGREKFNDLRRISGVQGLGMLAFSNGSLVSPGGEEAVDVSLVGVEPGQAGNPALLAGPGLRDKYGDHVLIDEKLAARFGLDLGDEITVRTVQGEEEEFFALTIVGLTDERQYFFAPTLIVPLYTWDEIRPQADPASRSGQPLANVIALQLEPQADPALVAERLLRLVGDIEVADKETVIRAQPGYLAQQTTVSTQRGFALFIGVLVVGGFFQIQTLQKVGQIGMLKAIGTRNATVGSAALLQIVLVTVVGVAIGGLGVLLLSLGLPETVPLRFSAATVAAAIASLLLIGPIGGLVSVRLALKIEPLTAIGL